MLIERLKQIAAVIVTAGLVAGNFFCLPRGEVAMTHGNGMVNPRHPSQVRRQEQRHLFSL